MMVCTGCGWEMPEEVATRRGIKEGWQAAHVDSTGKGACKGMWKRTADASQNPALNPALNPAQDTLQKDLTPTGESRTLLVQGTKEGT